MYQEQSPYENDDLERAKKQTKRLRWATHRAGNQEEGQKKRQSILNRLNRRSLHGGQAAKDSPQGGKGEGSDAGTEETATGRTIYFNIPLPDDAKDEEGHPITVFPRNKIRTAKYTPLSFIPKDLWFQFHNIANVYFLFIIILCVSRAHSYLKEQH